MRTQPPALVTETILTDPLDPSDKNFVPMIQHGSVTKHVVSENVSQWFILHHTFDRMSLA